MSEIKLIPSKNPTRPSNAGTEEYSREEFLYSCTFSIRSSAFSSVSRYFLYPVSDTVRSISCIISKLVAEFLSWSMHEMN